MFSRRLYRAAIIAAGSLLFIAATPAIQFAMTGDSSVRGNRPVDSTMMNIHSFDSTGLCTCLSHYGVEELSHAPKISLHKQALKFVHEYNKVNDYFLDKLKAKHGANLATIDEVFTKYNLPLELKYLAVIESKLDSKTVSSAGAVGMWQLMPDAARSFGLKVGGGRDERRNNYKSTVAAAKCLTYLHNMFDDWLLTLAAYNCGPGGVLKAIKKSGSRDFWVLQNFLPLETRNHVKKFIAIHYHFEGHGSLATMTKKETQAHIDAVAAFVKDNEKEAEKTDSLVKTENTTAAIER